MSTLIANTEHAERMMTLAKVTNKGIEITFADGCNGLVPFVAIPEIGNSSNVINIELPNLYQINIHVLNGELIELPWDFVRHYCDTAYQPKIEATASQGRQTLGKLIRTMRENAKMTQIELAKAAGIGRITQIRIEKGEQSPRYKTLIAIAQALKHPVAELVSGVSPINQSELLQETGKLRVEAKSSSLVTEGKIEAGIRGVILRAKAKIEQALGRALENDWKTSVGLLKEAKIIVPNEYYSDVKVEITMVWLCIQRMSIGPLITKAEKSVSMWDYRRANELLEDISSILGAAEFPLDFDDYSLRVINIASAACGAADRWENHFEKKLNRTLIGVGFIKANTEALEELMEKIAESAPARF